MAIVNRPTPDDFNKPEARLTPEKSRVVNILNITRTLGESVVSLLTGLLAAALILYSGYVLYDSFYTQNTAGNTKWDLLQYKPQIISDGATPLSGADTLAAINADYRAWLTMYETNIDYAVMQGTDDLYYASHDIYGKSSITGAIYLAAVNDAGFSDQYNLVYGHHMDNGAMFGALDDFAVRKYFDAHRYGVIVTRGGVYDLESFAVVRTDAYEPGVYGVAGKSAQDIIDFVNAYAGTVIKDMTNVNAGSKILALSTCASADTNGRLVVFLKMIPRNMTATTNGLLTLRVNTYNGVYDGLWHTIDVECNDPDALIEYSLDGGKTWTTARPSIRDVGELTLLIRASKGNMEEVSAISIMQVTPAPAVIEADDKSKVVGEEDPEFTATVTGLATDADVIEYAVTRPRAGTDEEIGVYPDTIIADGAAEQGNYTVMYLPGDFTITAAAAQTDIPEKEPPLAAPIRRFDPGGSSYGGERTWALVNLICLLLTFYITIPLMHLKAKFGRARLISRLEEEENQEARLEGRDPDAFAARVRKFKRRFKIGLSSEVIDVILSLIVFILTEDMHAPMVLIDRWTLVMVLLMFLCWGIDRRAIRVRDEQIVKEEKRIHKRVQKLKRTFGIF